MLGLLGMLMLLARAEPLELVVEGGDLPFAVRLPVSGTCNAGFCCIDRDSTAALQAGFWALPEAQSLLSDASTQCGAVISGGCTVPLSDARYSGGFPASDAPVTAVSDSEGLCSDSVPVQFPLGVAISNTDAPFSLSFQSPNSPAGSFLLLGDRLEVSSAGDPGFTFTEVYVRTAEYESELRQPEQHGHKKRTSGYYGSGLTLTLGTTSETITATE